MNKLFEQIMTILREMPLSRKIAMGSVLFFVIAGFAGIFLWANKAEYKVVYTDLATEDASEIVAKLKEMKVPYRIEKGGAVITVPKDKVHSVRLEVAGAGLPKGHGVGFEIFDKTDFGTTEFVQQLNYRRALQGELARTIREIEEVKDARVLIVMPKESVFVEDKKKPSASVFLKLRDKIPQGKVDAVAHLVASAIEGLSPELVTVVDSKGRILSSGTGEDKSSQQISVQLEHKNSFERNMAGKVQTMLEKIVGHGKAIVRVTADMDFSQVDENEEVYDPDGQVVRSSQNIADRSEKKSGPSRVSSVNPVVPPGQKRGTALTETKEHKDDTVNYEISKYVKHTRHPTGRVTRVSIAAVIDGTYIMVTDENGKRKREYVPRTPEEINLFTNIVKQAMGYSADREDQVSVESIAFSRVDLWGEEEVAGFDLKTVTEEYGRAIANVLLILLVFLFVVRPLIRTVRDVTKVEEEPSFIEGEEGGIAVDDEGRPIPSKLPIVTIQEKAARLAREDVNKTANIIKGWLSEG